MNRYEEGTTLKKQMSPSGIITLATLVLVLSSAAALAAGYADTYGFSAKGISMGNAMTAIVDDWSSTYYNIAGLGKSVHLRTTRTPEGGGEEVEEYLSNQMGVNYFYTAPQFYLHIPQRTFVDAQGNTEKLSTNGAKDLDFHNISLGMVVDLTKFIKILPDMVSTARWGLGMSFTDLGYLTKANDIDPRTHNFMRYGREAQTAVIATGVGMGFLEDFFGGGLGFNMAFHGQARSLISGVNIGPDTQHPPQQTKMDLQIAPEFMAGMYTNLKRIGGSHVDVNIGFSYRQETFLKIYPFSVETITKPGGIDMLLELAVFDYYTPHFLSPAVAVSFGRLTVTAQVDFELWSKFRFSNTMKKAFTDLQQAAAASGDTRSWAIPKFRDIYIPRVGLQARLADWVDLMAGYYWQQSFVPNAAVNGIFNFLDNNKHVVSIGARIGLPRLSFLVGQADLIIGAQFQILEKRKITKETDTSADITQSATINPNYSYGGWNPTITAELSMKI